MLPNFIRVEVPYVQAFFSVLAVNMLNFSLLYFPIFIP
jgi:hypothetical protein